MVLLFGCSDLKHKLKIKIHAFRNHSFQGAEVPYESTAVEPTLSWKYLAKRDPNAQGGGEGTSPGGTSHTVGYAQAQRSVPDQAFIVAINVNSPSFCRSPDRD